MGKGTTKLGKHGLHALAVDEAPGDRLDGLGVLVVASKALVSLTHGDLALGTVEEVDDLDGELLAVLVVLDLTHLPQALWSLSAARRAEPEMAMGSEAASWTKPQALLTLAHQSGVETTVLALEADEGWGAYEVVTVGAAAWLHETDEGVGVYEGSKVLV